jgi:Protein of unknown function (DUF2795)
MSMISSGTGGSGVAPFAWWGNRSRISWGAVLAGAAVAAATSLLLGLLGAAFGAGSIGDLHGDGDVARGAGFWTIINLILSMALGGYIASRLSGTHSHLDGELHGITMWAVAILISLLAFARLFGGLVEHVGVNVGPVVGAGGPAVMAATSDSGAIPLAVQQRFEQTLGAGGDLTTMSREQIAGEIRWLIGEDLARTGTFPEGDRTRLIALVAAQYGITKEEAGQRVAGLENVAKARLARIEERERALAEDVAQDATSASRALFTALTFGLLGALLGAWLGTRHKRILHPEEAHVPLHAEPAHLAQPVNVTVFEDDSHLVAQYLRGVTFPVSKQDLLRFARLGNAGPHLLQVIERLADRSYANANEVLASVGTSR